MRSIFIFPVLAVLCIGLVALTGTLPGQSGTSSGGQVRPQGPASTLPVSSDTGSATRSYPAGSSQAQIAALREDIRGLSAMVREQNLVIEEIQRRHRASEERMREYEAALRDLRESRNQASGNFATMNQVNRALEELNENVGRASRDQRREIIDQVSRQIDELARETQRAMDTLARNVSSRSSAPAVAPEPESTSRPSFSDDYPSEGVSYTVQSGDTLSAIASRFDSRISDIRNANRIEDPNRLQVGQTLFIPQRD